MFFSEFLNRRGCMVVSNTPAERVWLGWWLKRRGFCEMAVYANIDPLRRFVQMSMKGKECLQ